MVGDGVCKVTSKSATGATVVETRKDLLTPGKYTLTVANNGDVKIGAITRACGGTCSVNGTIYSGASGSGAAAGANASLTVIVFDTTAKTASGLVYGGSALISGATLAGTETGIVVFD